MSRLARPRTQAVAWAFVLAVAAYDVRWALAHQDTFDMWEANPAMRWVMAEHGVGAAAVFRGLTVVFAAAVVPWAPGRTRAAATAGAVAVHLYLAGVYGSLVVDPPGAAYAARPAAEWPAADGSCYAGSRSAPECPGGVPNE